MKHIKAVMIIGPGFEDVEALYPLHRLQEEGVAVDIATSTGGEVKGKHGIALAPTVKISQLKSSAYDVVIVPGGLEGPDRLRQVPAAVAFVKAMFDTKKLVASICHGPWVLISAGIMKGKKATCYIGMKDDLQNAGALYKAADVLVDGNLITSDHPRHLGAWMGAVIRYFS